MNFCKNENLYTIRQHLLAVIDIRNSLLIIISLSGDGCHLDQCNSVFCLHLFLCMLEMGITSDDVTRSQTGNVITLTCLASSHLTSAVVFTFTLPSYDTSSRQNLPHLRLEPSSSHPTLSWYCTLHPWPILS